MIRRLLGLCLFVTLVALVPRLALAQGAAGKPADKGAAGKPDAKQDAPDADTKAPPVAAPPPLAAPKGPEDVDKARELFKAGAKAFDAARFEVAAKLFDQAYDAAARPALRFSAAQALRHAYTKSRDLRQLRRSLAYYQQYVGEVKEGRRVRDAFDGIAEIELMLARAGVSETPAPSETPQPPTAKNQGTLQLDSSTPGAKAEIAGHPAVDKLPFWADLSPGKYQVTMSAKGFVANKRTIQVEAGRITVLDVKLEERPAQLTVKTDEGADLLVDGRAVGKGPLAGPLSLSSGAHRVVVGASGYRVEAVDLTLGRGESREVDVELGMTGQRITAWAVFSGAILAGATAVGLTGWAFVEQTRANQVKTESDEAGRALTLAEANSFNSHVQTRDDLRQLAGAAYVVSGLAGGIALLLFELDGADLYQAAAGADAPKGPASESAPEPDDESQKMELKASAAPLLDCQGSGGMCGGMVLLQGRF